MFPRRSVIVGYDAVSPLGTELDMQWRKAVAGESGIGALTRFAIDENFPVRVGGQVDDIDIEPYPFLKPRALALWPSPIFKYAMLTVYRALSRSGLEITSQIAPRTAITFSSAVGGQDALLSADRRMVSEGKLPPPYTNPNACINMVGGKISIMTGATGPISACITACATGLTSIIAGAMLIAADRADAAICGAVDFALIETIVAGFSTMNGAYTYRPDLEEEPPRRASRPFSADRRGFVISEGSGAVILVAEEIANAHGLKAPVRIDGWSMTSDARHFVAPSFENVRRCISESIQDAGIGPENIDSINAHATSTKLGDRVEYEAIKKVFGGKMPPVSANKSMTGHAMGASSAIETIFAIEGMIRSELLPTINYVPDPTMPMDCVSEVARKMEQEYVLKNAFGFGGCNSCIVLKRNL